MDGARRQHSVIVYQRVSESLLTTGTVRVRNVNVSVVGLQAQPVCKLLGSFVNENQASYGAVGNVLPVL